MSCAVKVTGVPEQVATEKCMLPLISATGFGLTVKVLVLEAAEQPFPSVTVVW